MSKVSKGQRKKLDSQQQLNACVLPNTSCMLLRLDYKARRGNTVKGKNDSRDFRSFASAQMLLIFGMWLAFK